MACSSTNKDVATQAPRSDDILELLTGFGESLSKRDFNKAVDFMVPEEKALMMEGGKVPTDKQKMLMALPLQKLIRHPAIRVDNGHIAGIYSVLPNLRQGEASPMASAEIGSPDTSASDPLATGTRGPMGTNETASADATNTDMSEVQSTALNESDPQLKSAVNKFFTAVNRRNWTSALAMMNEGEKKLLLDDKGRLKESAKQRLTQIDQKNREALILQDGKLTGVTLLLPSD
ncbi:MAG: hypothetical protein ABIW76_02080 [Fibrobacteria bacterium]